MDLGTAVGVTSLGIEICKALFEYYSQVKDANVEIRQLWKRVAGFESTLRSIAQILNGKLCSPDLLEHVIATCLTYKELLEKLHTKLQKISTHIVSDGLAVKMLHGVERALYPFRRSTLCKLEEMIQDMQPELGLILGMAFHDIDQRALQQGFISVSSEMRTLQKTLVKFRDDKDHDSIMEWLTSTDPGYAQNNACRLREPGTGRWLLKTQEFSDWISNEGSTLWLHGKPGCGKTILCSTIVECIEAKCAIKSDMQSAYYYFSFSEGTKQDLANCVSSLIVQLCRSRSAPKSLRSLYTIRKHSRPDTEQLSEILKELINDCENTYIQFDAIDECPESDDQREAVLDFISDLRVSARSKLHLLVLSRDEADIRLALMFDLHATEVHIGTRQIQDDINRYVRSQLTGHRRLKTSLSPELLGITVQSIAEKADGMFRWAYCQIERLKKLRLARAKDIEFILGTLPNDLNQTYERILCDISDYERDAVTAALRWLVFSETPLNPVELAYATSIHVDALEPPSEGTLVSPEGLLELLSSLVAVDEETYFKTVKLAHFTVQEYLLSDAIMVGPAAAFALQTNSSQSLLARQCFSYILQCRQDFPNEEKHEFQTQPFLVHASSAWIYHQRAVTERTDKEADLSFLEVLFNEVRYRKISGLYREVVYLPLEEKNKSSQEGSPLYTTSLFGLDFCILRLLNEGHNVNAIGGLCYTPLQAAASRGHTSVVGCLLEAGADAMLQGGQFYNALGAAAWKGHGDVIDVLLSRGGNMFASASQGAALFLAIMQGHLPVVKKFVKIGIDLEIVNDRFGTPLMAATRWGQPEIAELLIDHGAAVNTTGVIRNRKWVNPLQCAASCQMDWQAVETVRLLIKRGADPNTVQGEHGTALITACEATNADTAIALLEYGADPYLHVDGKGTPAELAKERGMKRFVDALRESSWRTSTTLSTVTTATSTEEGMQEYF